MDKILATIITIGDELLIGQTIDTNSAWMAKELNEIGVWVLRRVAVGDNWDEIWKTLDEESQHAQIILITGGLGPTADDITKPLLCEYFGGKLVVDEGALQNVKNIFKRLNRPMIERNLKQAEVPDVCTVIPNRRGTAPGMWFEKNGKIYVSMPGVPHEMKGMMIDYILPKLPEYYKMPFILHRTLLTAGVGESFLAEMIQDLESSLPAYMKLAYLPNFGMVRLRLTVTGLDKQALENELEETFLKLQGLVKEYMVTNTDETLETIVGRLLHSKKMTMGTAESCTGGFVAHLITSVPGSSKYYKGSIISYSNEIKKEILNVQQDVLDTVGAVSEETVIQMVKGAVKTLNVDYAVATSGIMGPDGGTPEKPVGTVWIAAGNKDQVTAEKFSFRFDRSRNIDLTATYALNMIRKFILEH
ncbi:MAG: competence/damage-inducible protein A [Bacteroidetes bacterium]|nr:MAG: competence/damage-inducible protein A [Bacteroidota bacterium]